MKLKLKNKLEKRGGYRPNSGIKKGYKYKNSIKDSVYLNLSKKTKDTLLSLKVKLNLKTYNDIILYLLDNYLNKI